jgi:hypothetical protein
MRFMKQFCLVFGLLSILTLAEDKTPMPSGITLCVAPMNGDFDGYLIGEMQKQKVPVTIISSDPDKGCDPSKSFYTMVGTQDAEGKSFSARSVFGLRVHSRSEIQAAVRLVRNSDRAIVWAGDSDRGETKKVAEHIVKQMLKQRPMWIPSPQAPPTPQRAVTPQRNAF